MRQTTALGSNYHLAKFQYSFKTMCAQFDFQNYGNLILSVLRRSHVTKVHPNYL